MTQNNLVVVPTNFQQTHPKLAKDKLIICLYLTVVESPPAKCVFPWFMSELTTDLAWDGYQIVRIYRIQSS